MKKIFTTLLIAVLASTSCFAFEFTVNNVRYDVSPTHTTALVKALPNNEKYKGNIIIPKTVEYNGNKYKVTEIFDKAFAKCQELTSVMLPEGITTIGKEAFWGCINLKEINLPSTLTYIGDACFASCSNLQSITIPEKLKEIGDWTFSDCTSLEKITIPGNVKLIYKNAFRDCFNLQEVNIENGVQFIGSYAFSGCQKLETVNIPQSVVHLSEKAFMYCENIKTLNVENDTIIPKYYGTNDNISSYLEDAYAYNVLNKKLQTYGLNRGFKGSVKFGAGALGKEKSGKEQSMTLDLNVGYQFTPVVFVGVGWDYFGSFDENFFNDSELYANARFSLPTRITPYLEIRGGYRPFHMQTPYWAPELGFRYGITKDIGISFGMSYENICAKKAFDPKHPTSEDAEYEKYWNRGIMFKLGVDF